MMMMYHTYFIDVDERSNSQDRDQNELKAHDATYYVHVVRRKLKNGVSADEDAENTQTNSHSTSNGTANKKVIAVSLTAQHVGIHGRQWDPLHCVCCIIASTKKPIRAYEQVLATAKL